MEEQKGHSQEVEMNDSSLMDMRSLKIKSIDGQTYEITVPKDVSRFVDQSLKLSFTLKA